MTGTQFEFVSTIDDEEDLEEERVLHYVHAVTTNAFDDVQLFRYRVDAIHYAMDFVSAATGAACMLPYREYSIAYNSAKAVMIRSSDTQNNLCARVRLTRIRRDKCVPRIRGE